MKPVNQYLLRLLRFLPLLLLMTLIFPIPSVYASATEQVRNFQAQALLNWTSPIQAKYLPIPGTGRDFGAPREGGRLHAALDYYVVNGHGTPVYAMESGQVIQFSPNFYAGTQAIAVQHADGSIARYCEISTNLRAGDQVVKGQQLGQIMANQNEGGTMLHLELYLGSAQGSLTDTQNTGYSFLPAGNYCRRSDLLDPGFLLHLP